MKLTNTYIVGLVVGAATLLGVAHAHAAVVFSDTFEDTTGSLPNAPQTGSYPTDPSTDPESTVVTAGSPHLNAPDGGTKLLYTTGKDRNYGLLTAPATGTGTLVFDFDASLRSSTDLAFGFFGNGGGSISLDGYNIGLWFKLSWTSTGGTKLHAYQGGWVDITAASGLNHTLDEWQHYTITYELGATSFTLSIDGGTPVTVNAINAAMTQVDGVLLGQGGTDSTLGYADNISVTFPVPEPASLGLIAVAIPLIWTRRR